VIQLFIDHNIKVGRKGGFMEIRNAVSPKEFKHYTTGQLREDFLIRELFVQGQIKMIYSQIDRIIIGAAVPIAPLTLMVGEEIKADYFLQRREIGIINIGGKGSVTVDGKTYELENKEGLYIGMGSKEITYSSVDRTNPAKFYFNSTPAHRTCPTVLIKPENCVQAELGSLEQSNHRVITKYILPGQVESCQLVMGMTKLKPGSVWNTMPCHTHDRRMEVYLYFDLPEDGVVFHYMGEPSETRHIIMRNEEAVISPSWSIHSGSGTQAYTFIWGMAGENQDFNDMDPVPVKALK
jgi:4-deoxy-L-threo-5-hexosulose-uronate ketol-isomerase